MNSHSKMVSGREIPVLFKISKIDHNNWDKWSYQKTGYRKWGALKGDVSVLNHYLAIRPCGWTALVVKIHFMSKSF